MPVAPPPPAASPLAKTVTLRFEAEPSGAHVFAKKDGKEFARSPSSCKLPKGPSPSAYLFRLAGYREVALTAKPNADRTLHVSLEKLARADPDGQPTDQAPRPPAPPRRRQAPEEPPSTKTPRPPRRFSHATRRLTTAAGSGGRRGWTGQGGPAVTLGQEVQEALRGQRDAAAALQVTARSSANMPPAATPPPASATMS